MLDIIVIGKESHGKSDKPHMVYCGQSREEAIDAVIKCKGGKLSRFYYVSGEPFQLIRSPDVLESERAEAQARHKERQDRERAIHDDLKLQEEKLTAEKKRLAQEEEAAREQYRRDEAEREAAARAPKSETADESPVKRGRKAQ